MDILGKRKIWYTISLIVIAIALFSLIFKGGLNLGIDFNGGTLLEYSFDQELTTEEIRDVLSEVGLRGATIQLTEDETNSVIIRTRDLNVDEMTAVNNALVSTFPSAEALQQNTVGPVIGQELRSRAVLAILIAAVAVIIYVSYRFELRFAIAALIALLHDVVITVGIFSLLQIEINTAFVAALLTIVGYSINDTIVIFDRARENMKLMRNSSFIEQANSAVVDTLPRSINTSLTTLIVVLAIIFFGGSSIRHFMLALFIGMLAGTYSSIFLASPLLITWQEKLKTN